MEQNLYSLEGSLSMPIYMVILYIDRERGQGTKTREKRLCEKRLDKKGLVNKYR